MNAYYIFIVFHKWVKWDIQQQLCLKYNAHTRYKWDNYRYMLASDTTDETTSMQITSLVVSLGGASSLYVILTNETIEIFYVLF